MEKSKYMNIFCSFAFRLILKKMKINNIFCFLALSFFIFSCSSKKDILYIQDSSNDQNLSVEYREYLIKADDVLKIDISAEEPSAALFLNPRGANSNLNSNKQSLLYNGYQVNPEGYINFPAIGKIKVAGISVSDLRNKIYSLIIGKGILNNPHVDIKILNTYFIVLGEVNKPGRYEFLENNLNILEAIGMAGDLTITGDRKNVKIFRDGFEKKTLRSVDLTKSKFISNDDFQIFSGDIIIVNQNKTRVKNAGIIGNSGTLLSLLSFILSSIIVISNK